MACGVVGMIWLLTAALATLPDHQKLAAYQPSLSSKVYSSDGKQIGLFARENRSFMPIEQIPNHVIAAFMSAEDKDFYTHSGIDPVGIARASIFNITKAMFGKRMQGASTITQQVSQNVIVPDDEQNAGYHQEHGLEHWISKIQVMLISVRIEGILTKDQIMEIYLNQIFLGFRSYGVEAASQTYFQKSVKDISISQAAYLATLPKGPTNYNPIRHPDRALARRNWVISRMLENGFITAQQAAAAQKDPLDYKPVTKGSWTDTQAGEFVEEVRRDIIRRFGKDAPYTKGFIITSTVDIDAQRMAREALQRGLDRFGGNRERGFMGAVGYLNVDDKWKSKIAKLKIWQPDDKAMLAVVMDDVQKYGLKNGETITIPQADRDWVLRSGKTLEDGGLVWLRKLDGTNYQLLRRPSIQGALVSLNARNGSVLAMAGGYDLEDSSFNRATQAKRQVGSTFKPIIYAAALEQGMTPDTKISDAKLEGGGWGPENSDHKYYGVMTLRQGLVLSRNTITVRIAKKIGMRRVADYARRFGVYDDLPNDLTMALGAGETTALKMTAGFAVFPNGGRYIPPVFFDRLQDTKGKTVWRADRRSCSGCDAPFNPNTPPPKLEPYGTQVVSPRTAWDMTNILRDVVTSGTGKRAQFGRPVGGKTGTTNDYKDAWFIGFTPTYSTGVYVGYDIPRTIAHGAAGGVVAAPIFSDYMSHMLAGKPVENFEPSKEVLDEIGAEERMDVIAELQKNPNLIEKESNSNKNKKNTSIIR